jgi:hypothetical protein
MRASKLAAIALSGGAVVSLLTPAVALAGDADSTGNSATTDHGQSLTATPGSDPTIGAQDAGEANAGAAGANAGGNSGTGNSDENESETENTDQINADSAENESEGSVANTSGNAKAAGNQSTSQLRQDAVSSGKGGGLTLIGQHAFILSAGGAYADTGWNDGDDTHSGDATAWGNASATRVGQQVIVEDEDGTLRLVDQADAVANLGAAVALTGFDVGDAIDTGNATAGGSQSTTSSDQGATITEAPTGPAIVDQNGLTTNAGAGIANTGINETSGDDSTNEPE